VPPPLGHPTPDRRCALKPSTPAQRLRVAFAEAAAQVSDYTRALVTEGIGEEDSRPGEYIVFARRARAHVNELVQRAVMLERARGASWEEIAAALGHPVEWVRDEYEPAYERWLVEGGAPWQLEDVEGRRVDSQPPPPSVAQTTRARLRRWAARA
jgi:hypothetical protein